MTDIRTAHTADLDREVLTAARTLLDGAFEGGFGDETGSTRSAAYTPWRGGLPVRTRPGDQPEVWRASSSSSRT